MSPDPQAALTPGEVLATRLQLEEAAAAMDAAMRRAARSAGSGRDGITAAGFHTPTGALLVSGRESHPLLVEAAAEALGILVGRQAPTDRALAPGDLYLTNDPGCGGASLEDLILATPLMQDGRLQGFVVLTASHLGVSRATLAPATSLRQEGLILPWMRVGHLGRFQPDVLALLAANAEDPGTFRDDLFAQAHCLGLGRSAAEDLLAESGTEALTALGEATSAGARRALVPILERLASGDITGSGVRLHRDGDGLCVSLLDRDRWADLGLTPTLTRAAVRAALREVLTAESPTLAVLGGLDGRVRVEPPRSMPSPHPPMGAARFAGAQALAEAILAALAESFPHLVHAPDAACLLLDLRGRREDGSRYRVRLGLPGGLGASVFGDGLAHATSPFSPHRTQAVEDIERAIPVRLLRLQLLPDSAGPGQYHGGTAACLELQLLEGEAVADILVPGKAIGMRGGMRGAPARTIQITARRGTQETVGPARIVLDLTPGDRLILESAGGGGWGIPFQRSIMRLEEDLARGLISPDQSRNRYGLVLVPGTFVKDDHLTYRVRHYLLSTLAVEDIIAGEELLE